MISLIIAVLCGIVIVFGPRLIEAHEKITLADLLEQVSYERYLENSMCVKTGKDEHSPIHEGTLNQPLFTFYNYGDRFVKFIITKEEKQQCEPRNALAVLMRPKPANCPRCITQFITTSSFYLMVFVLCYWIKKWDLCMMIEGVGHQLVQTLTDVLWYIDGQYYNHISCG